MRRMFAQLRTRDRLFWERCQSLAFVAPRVMRLGRMMRGPSVASLLIHRSVWRRVGGFPDLRAAEDRIFFRKLEEQGVRLDGRLRQDAGGSFRSFRKTFSKMLLYSKHNVWAGEQKNWHFGIARMYVVGLLLAVALLIYDPRLLPLVLHRSACSNSEEHLGAKRRPLRNLGPESYQGVGSCSRPAAD